MSEKAQGTNATMQARMLRRYGDEVHHKHNKDHHHFRMHCRTHPAAALTTFDKEFEKKSASGLLRLLKLRRMRKRLDAGQYH